MTSVIMAGMEGKSVNYRSMTESFVRIALKYVHIDPSEWTINTFI